MPHVVKPVLAAACGLVAAALPPALAAQRPLVLRLHAVFEDPATGGNGAIGVTRADTDGRFYVVDFSSDRPLHSFDPAGGFLGATATAGGVPAVESPNDLVHDPTDDTLWLVDNSPGTVAQLDRHSGDQLGGFAFQPPTSNPVGIAFDRRAGSLWISSEGRISEWSRSGERLAGDIEFRPPAGSAVLSGVAHDLARDRFYVTQSAGHVVYELDRSGALASTTSLAPFGIVNTQGIDYDFERRQLLVVDNTLSKVFVFDVGAGRQPRVQRVTSPCPPPAGGAARLDWFGAAGPGRVLTLVVHAPVGGTAPLRMLVGPSRRGPDPLARTCAASLPSPWFELAVRRVRPGMATSRLRVPDIAGLVATELCCQAVSPAPAAGSGPASVAASDALLVSPR